MLWLENETAAQQDLANAWLTRTDKTRDEEWAGIYDKSGSCVRVFVDACNSHHRLRVAQDVSLIVTDGAIAIPAFLSPDCLRLNHFPEPGLLLAVRKYTIRYTPYGLPGERLDLTLDVAHAHDGHDEQFQALVGDLKPVNTCEKVTTVLRDLQQTLVDSDRTSFGTMQRDSEEMDIMASQDEGGDSIHGETSPHTQTAFGTQIAQPMRTPSKTIEQRTKKPFNDDGNDSRRTAVLLDLLYKSAQPTVLRTPILASKSNGEGLGCSPTEPRATREGCPNTGPPSQANNARYNTTHNNASKAPSAGGFSRISTSRISEGCIARPESTFQPTRMPPLYQESNITKAPSAVVGKGISSPVFRAGKGTSDKANTTSGEFSQSPSETDALEDTVPDWLKDTCRADGCGRVPTAQAKLLSSWQKHRVGTNDRFPDANIPIDVLKALKRFEVNVASSDGESSDEEGNTASNVNSPSDNNDVLSDSDNGTKFSWSSSPDYKSPERAFHLGPGLPPDSSLQSKDAESQDGSQEASPSQEAQRVVVIESSNEEITINPPSSPPLVPDDDVDMDMELAIPHGLGEESPIGKVVPSSRTHRAAAIVQVNETPYPKGKSTASASTVNPTTQAQQQTSSGTSKDTSTTSIVFSTYKEKSLERETTRDAKATSSKSAAFLSLYEGHRDMTESEDNQTFYSANDAPAPQFESDDVRMDDAQEEPLQFPGPSSRRFEREQQQMHVPTPPSGHPDNRGRHNGCEQQHSENRSSPFASLPQHLMSVQVAHPTVGLADDTVPVKRKIEASSSKNDRRPSKRRDIKLMNFRSNSPVRDIAEELRREKEEHLRRFTERARTGSMNNNLSDNDATPGVRSVQLPVHHKDSGENHHAPANVQPHSAWHADAAVVLQMDQQAHNQGPQFTASAEQKVQRCVVPANDTRSLNHSELAGHPVALGPHEDVDMDTHNDRADNADLEVTDIDTNLANADAEDVIINETVLQGTDAKDVEFENDVVDNTDIGHTESSYDISSHDETNCPQPPLVPSTPAPVPVASEKSRIATQPPESATIFENFKRTYPTYTGDMRHFLGQCKTIDKFDQQDKMVPKWQWDDFIIRNRTDYRDYANQCLDNGEDVEPYYRFYKDNIRDTLHIEGVIGNRKTLLAAIEELEGKATAKISAPEVPTSETVGAAGSVTSSPVANVSVTKPTKSNGPLATTADPKITAAKASATKASTAKVPAKSFATTERPSPGPSVLKKRQSLPSAFTKRTERITSRVPTPSNERPRQSLPAPSSTGIFSLTSPGTIHHSTPARQPGHLSTPNSVSTRAPSLRRTNSGPRIPTEPTGDPYRDFVFAQSRATSFTGSTRVDTDPKKKWPENLHVRPQAETKRKGYDVLSWKDDL